ncbi:FSCN1 [Cordylochernes scorpioides]|uniref:FSCN1 n=1 Tax=Cordylochernes scorpioides TaxID=51811 RepID=A0ABY6KA02_9ARAC|nr:FSCN1 [Cordylochernes scorpioides]
MAGWSMTANRLFTAEQRELWSVGLINAQSGRYLTAETFGHRVNASGAGLKRRQLWQLEPAAGGGVCLRSHLGTYLAVDGFGNVACVAEEREEPGATFLIWVSDDGTGRWALKNELRGYYLGASGDKLVCGAKSPGPGELWTVHLAARPQVLLRSLGRRRFARAVGDEVLVDANTPWGQDTLFTLDFQGGRYALHAAGRFTQVLCHVRCDGRFLASDGLLVAEKSPDCLYTLEFHQGHLALADSRGRYLAPIGSRATLRAKSTFVTKDELFSLEDSVPQAAFMAFNSKYVSVKQAPCAVAGVDLSANQDLASDHETFQLEHDPGPDRWYLRTLQDTYWTLDSSSGIQARADKGSTLSLFLCARRARTMRRSANCLFKLEWLTDGTVALVANNGRYVGAKRSGHLFAVAETPDGPCERFHFELAHRSSLVLRCEQGYVGFKSTASPRLECNKATYELIHIENDTKGAVFLRATVCPAGDGYLHLEDDGAVAAEATGPRQGFHLELRAPGRLGIKTTQGRYLVADKTGALRASTTEAARATLWEY